LRSQLGRIQLEPTDLENWSEAQALSHALRSVGAGQPDLSALQAKLEAGIDSGANYHPTVWSSALQMGLIDAEHRARLAQRPDVLAHNENFRGERVRPQYLRYGEYEVSLMADELADDPVLRERVAEGLEVSWPDEKAHGALEGALLCVRSLDAIGESARAEQLRDRVHALLVSHWISDNTRIFSILGGFTSDPVKFRTSFDDQTWFAVQLMERFGVPPEIDLRLLRGHLRTESRVMFFDTAFSLNAMSRASLRVLEDKIGMPPRSPLQRVLDERLLIASLLLVGLCLLAIRLAPSFEPDTSRGAQP
jgi:hypothetical protein